MNKPYKYLEVSRFKWDDLDGVLKKEINNDLYTLTLKNSKGLMIYSLKFSGMKDLRSNYNNKDMVLKNIINRNKKNKHDYDHFEEFISHF